MTTEEIVKELRIAGSELSPRMVTSSIHNVLMRELKNSHPSNLIMALYNVAFEQGKTTGSLDWKDLADDLYKLYRKNSMRQFE